MKRLHRTYCVLGVAGGRRRERVSIVRVRPWTDDHAPQPPDRRHTIYFQSIYNPLYLHALSMQSALVRSFIKEIVKYLHNASVLML